MDIAYISDVKFIKSISNPLMDLFRYRIQLSPDQFADDGYAERKMLLVLDIYDIIKSIKSQTKVDKKLNFRDPKFERGEEMAVRKYEVIDHTNGIAKSMQFNMNAAMKKVIITCK